MLKVRDWIKSKSDAQFTVVTQSADDIILIVKRIKDGKSFSTGAFHRIEKASVTGITVTDDIVVRKFHKDLINVDVCIHTFVNYNLEETENYTCPINELFIPEEAKYMINRRSKIYD